MDSSTTGKVALVFGASGISGWAVTNNLFTYPTPGTFSRIIGLTNRPLDVASSALPADDRRLELYSGINLREDLETVTKHLSKTVPKLEEVTHVYYCAYSNATAYSQDVMEIRNINVQMTGNAVRAVDALCQKLEFLVLQTGTNNYGVAVFRYQDKIDINPPLKEDQPRVPSPWGDEIFYYGQVDLIKEVSEGKSWRWCEVRPDTIVGFVPGITSMTFLEPVALFLALWRYVHGKGAEIPFIGTKENYLHTSTDSSQDLIARAEIYLSTKDGVVPASGEAYNIGDHDTPHSWKERWEVVAEYFGLHGKPPIEPAENTFPADKWWEEHQEDYARMVAEHGLSKRTIPPETWIFALVAGYSLLRRDRGLSLEKIRAAGFTEQRPLGKGHIIGFERMVAAGIIPEPSQMTK